MRFFGLFILLLLSRLPLSAADAAPYVRGRILVGHRAGVDDAAVERTLRGHRASVRRQVAALRFSVVDIAEESSEAVVESLRRSGVFAFVERDAYAHTAGDAPNDPSYVSQWHLQRIQSAQAWDVTTGAGSLLVAVVDSGIYPFHPDLAPKLVAGWNFVDMTPDTSDTMGHGTAVAGTLAAATNNGIGIASVNWRSPVLPLVVVDRNDQAAYSEIAAAIQYAADRGARVINVSVGGKSPSVVLQTAVDYAWNKGAVIFASAMNRSTSERHYPAACNRVIAVSATDGADHLAGFSNYGDWITLAAPGANILSTVNGGGYGYWSGTSFASPIVAGVAALCLAVNPDLTNAELVSLLKETADDLGAPGFDTSFGWGRVNAARAVEAARPAVPSMGAGRMTERPYTGRRPR